MMLVLGFAYPDNVKAAQALGLAVEDDEIKLGESEALPRLNEAIRRAQRRAFEQVAAVVPGFRLEGLSEELLAARTPLGRRRFAPWALACYRQADEDYVLENDLLGIALLGHGLPSYLDWRESEGDPHILPLSTEANRLIDLARRSLTDVHPVFATAVPVMTTLLVEDADRAC